MFLFSGVIKEVIYLNRDRGRIKWTALMLPEHVEQLKMWQQEENIAEIKEPDEQQLEEWNYRIASAMELNTPLCITFRKNGELFNEVGLVHHLDYEIGALRLITNKGDARIIKFTAIKNFYEEA